MSAPLSAPGSPTRPVTVLTHYDDSVPSSPERTPTRVFKSIASARVLFPPPNLDLAKTPPPDTSARADQGAPTKKRQPSSSGDSPEPHPRSIKGRKVKKLTGTPEDTESPQPLTAEQLLLMQQKAQELQAMMNAMWQTSGPPNQAPELSPKFDWPTPPAPPRIPLMPHIPPFSEQKAE